MPLSQRLQNRWLFGTAIFVFSVLLSLTLKATWLTRPLAGNHEWNTAHVAISLENWTTHGVLRHRFVPILGYSQPGDREVPIEALQTSPDSEGIYHYTSWPPFGFILPFIFYTTTALPADLAIKVFNTILGLTAAGIAMWSGYSLAQLMGLKAKWLGGAAAASFASLTPAFLWIFSNNYFVQCLSAVLYFAQVTILFRLMQLPAKAPVWVLVAGASVQFLLALTDWFSVVWLGGWVIAALWVRSQIYRRYLFTLVVTTFAAFSLTILLYRLELSGAAVAGHAESRILAHSFVQLLQLSKHTAQVPFFLVDHFLDPYLPITLTLAFILPVLFYTAVLNAKPVRIWLAYCCAACIGPFLCNVTFLAFTAHHDFSLLPLMLSLTPALAVGFVLFTDSLRERGLPWAELAGATLLFVFLIFPLMFWLNNHRPWQRDYRYISIGEQVAASTLPTQIAILRTESDFVHPNIVFYAKRNVITETTFKNRVNASQSLRLRPLHVLDETEIEVPGAKNGR